ncbi:MAG: hypothetical protein H6706_31225 [Myxococcales bacterium]|nr:hypothetical protein [Myxococcales bacterium]
MKTTRDRWLDTLRALVALGGVLPGDEEQDVLQAAQRAAEVVKPRFRQAGRQPLSTAC